MTRRLLTGNAAAAWGARLAEADYVPAFPITPQTEIIETLSRWIEDGEIPARMVTLESEHSMLTAAAAAAATGVRVFSATSSQGLLYGMEMLYTVSGWRAPFVLMNVSRGIATPVTLEADHNDAMAARDSGFLQLHCATCQEVLDTTLIAYRLAEDPRVRLPVLVNLDGFTLSFTREPVDVPEPDEVRDFLPPFDPGPIRFRASEPTSQAVVVLGGTAYSYFRYQEHLAAQAAIAVHREVVEAFAERFGRRYDAVETHRADDAEVVFVIIGSSSTRAREVVDRLREAGRPVGLVRPRMLRPYPAEDLRRALDGKRAVAVVDQNLSPGRGGVLHTELSALLHDVPGRSPVLVSFIGGLGGRDIVPEEFQEMVEVAFAAAQAGAAPPPRLLFTRAEMEEVERLQAIAGTREIAGAEAPQEGRV